MGGWVSPPFHRLSFGPGAATGHCPALSDGLAFSGDVINDGYVFVIPPVKVRGPAF
jgi:hypothetical protein